MNTAEIIIIFITIWLFIDSIFSIVYITKQKEDNTDVKKTAIAFNSITLGISVLLAAAILSGQYKIAGLF
jgi:hypothetical protein